MVSEYILKLVYHCNGGRWSEICFPRDIDKNLLSRLLLLVILKSSYPRCIVEKDVHKNFTNFTGEHLCWSLFLAKLLVWGPSTLLKRNSIADVFQSNLQHFSGHLFWRTFVSDCFCIFMCFYLQCMKKIHAWLEPSSSYIMGKDFIWGRDLNIAINIVYKM